MDELLNPGKLLYYIYDFFGAFMKYMNIEIDLGIMSFKMWHLFAGGGAGLFMSIAILIIIKRVVPLA